MSFEVTYFNITNWDDNGVVHNPHTILKVIHNVIKVQQENGGRIAVHCRYKTRGIGNTNDNSDLIINCNNYIWLMLTL